MFYFFYIIRIRIAAVAKTTNHGSIVYTSFYFMMRGITDSVLNCVYANVIQ